VTLVMTAVISVALSPVLARNNVVVA